MITMSLSDSRKIQRAFCPPKVVEGNPITRILCILVFEKPRTAYVEARPEVEETLKCPAMTSSRRICWERSIRRIEDNILRILSEKLEPSENTSRRSQPLEEVRNWRRADKNWSAKFGRNLSRYETTRRVLRVKWKDRETHQ